MDSAIIKEKARPGISKCNLKKPTNVTSLNIITQLHCILYIIFK